MKQLLLAIQFLTIIPVRVKGEVYEKDLADSTAFFPFVGALQGLLIVVTVMLSIKVFPKEVVSGLAILVHLISNGGFDLDGLIDTFDALAIKSTGDPQHDIEKRLSVMRDSSIGAIGAIALVMNILLKFLFLNALFHAVPSPAVLCVLFLMPVLSKWITVPAMYHGVCARKDGLGRIFIDNILPRHVFLSSGSACLLYLLIAKIHLYRAYGLKAITLLLVLFVSLYLFNLLCAWFSFRRFGGLTGDTLGAMSEISEIFVLMVGYLWLRISI